MRKLLFLDDIRNPFENPEWLVFSPIHEPYEVIWVKNYNEFINYIEKNGLPTGICFDHDLHPEHYTPEEYWDDYNKSKEYQESKTYIEKNGYDCSKWLIEYCENNNKPLPKYNIHSQNPVGKDNIKYLLENYKKFISSK